MARCHPVPSWGDILECRGANSVGADQPIGKRGADREEFIGSRDSRSSDNAKRCLYHQDSQLEPWTSANLVSRDSASVDFASVADVERAADRVARWLSLAAIVERPVRSVRASADMAGMIAAFQLG
jgi:hypothetical protein